MKLIALSCSGVDSETSLTLSLPADWTAIPLDRALRIAFGKAVTRPFVFRDAAYRECVLDENEDRTESGLSFATPLSALFPKNGWRLLWLRDRDERLAVLRRIGEEEGEGPVCREASGTTYAASSVTDKLRGIRFAPGTDDRPGDADERRFKPVVALPEECDPDEILDGEAAGEGALAAAISALPPPPASLPELEDKARAGDRKALAEWSDRFVYSFPRDLLDVPGADCILQGLSRAVLDGDIRAKTVAGRWLLESPSMPPAARFRGWTLLREAADAGSGKAWDTLGRTCMDWCILDSSNELLEPLDPERRLLPAADDIPDFALHCFRRATECGCAAGWNGLSWAAGEGIGTPDGERDDRLSEEYDRRGAEAGDSHSCFNLARRLAERPETDRTARIRIRREALDLFVRGTTGTDILEDEFQDVAEYVDHWIDFGKVDPSSLSALLFHEGIERFYRCAADRLDDDTGSDDDSDCGDETPEPDGTPDGNGESPAEESEKRLKENRLTLNAWIDWMSFSCGAPANRGLELAIARLRDPDAAPKQLRAAFHAVQEAADSTDDPAAWEQLARCYEDGLGIYRNKNRAARCRKIAEKRKAILENAEKTFSPA